MFLVFLGSNGCLWSLWICDVASLDIYETGWRGKLGLGKISGPMHHHFNHFLKVLWEMHIFRGSFLVFWGSDGGQRGHICMAWLL